MGSIVPQDSPHYYRVQVDNPASPLRSCGSKEDLEMVLSLYPTATWEKVYLPQSPSTVDVMYVDVGEEQVLPAQQILQPSDLEPFEP